MNEPLGGVLFCLNSTVKFLQLSGKKHRKKQIQLFNWEIKSELKNLNVSRASKKLFLSFEQVEKLKKFRFPFDAVFPFCKLLFYSIQ